MFSRASVERASGSSQCVPSSCAVVHQPRAESAEAATEPGAGPAAKGWMHLHRPGSARLSGPTAAQEHRPAQRLK